VKIYLKAKTIRILNHEFSKKIPSKSKMVLVMEILKEIKEKKLFKMVYFLMNKDFIQLWFLTL